MKGLFCSHCSGRGSSILCILGLENPLLTGECLVQLDKHRCFPEIPKRSRAQRLTFIKSTMLISAVRWVRACLQLDQVCLDVIENYGHLCNLSLPLSWSCHCFQGKGWEITKEQCGLKKKKSLRMQQREHCLFSLVTITQIPPARQSSQIVIVIPCLHCGILI